MAPTTKAQPGLELVRMRARIASPIRLIAKIYPKLLLDLGEPGIKTITAIVGMDRADL